nr:TolC family protein [Klebsiella pneumoniae subsp. pneumoniae]
MRSACCSAITWRGKTRRVRPATPLRLPSQLPSTLLNRRPDIAQAERQLVAADATLASSQAQLLPSINLTATGSLQDRTLPDLLDNPLRLWSLGGSILVPLLNRRVKCPGGRLHGPAQPGAL